ncbi:MAG: diguanylate cyclase [Deltaproteobacteria bacterium]|nr:diguanylate cyclase [Deltaproteobacteria bacterium]
MRILIVDDEETIRGILSRVLGQEGYEVTLAESGEEALEIFGKDPHPLVLTDIRMGGMSGMELLTEIRGINSETQVLIMTSYASLETAIEALRLGAYDYMVKPFEDLDLVTATISRAGEKIRLSREIQSLIETLKGKNEELEVKNRILAEQASYDGLTQLHNHRHFQETLAIEVSRSLRHGRTFSLIFMDVDLFKNYNDTHGHLKGDSVLRTIGEILKNILRKTDTAARYGGDEFVLLLPETDKGAAQGVGELVRKTIESHPFYGRDAQPGGKVTVSVGVASFPADGTDAANLVQSADKALYESKDSGKNIVTVVLEARK